MKRKILIPLLLLAAVAATFGRTLGHDFIDWDDRALIYGNKNLNPPTLNGLAAHWKPGEEANDQMYDPVVYTVWWSLAHFARMDKPDLLGATLNPSLFHAANLIVHWLTACFVFQILLKLNLRDWPAAAGALLFAAHSLQTEPVAWATGLKDLLSGLFAMAAIWRYLFAAESQGKQAHLNYAAATILFIAALLAKPSTVVIPAIVVVLEVVILGRPLKKSLARMLPWLGLAILAGCLAMKIQTIHDVAIVPLWQRPLIALDAVTFYLAKLFIPINLNFDYGRTPAVALTEGIRWLRLLPFMLAVFIWKSRQKLLMGGGIIFLIALLPVLGFLPFMYQFYSTVADRYAYLPMLGAAIGFGWFVQRYGKQGAFAAAVLLIGWSGGSFVYASVWQNTRTLFEYGSALNPNHFNPLHYDVLAQYLERDSQLQSDPKPDLNEAIDCYRRSIQADPLFPRVYNDLTDDLLRVGKNDEALEVQKSLMNIQPRLPSELRQKPAVLNYQLGMLYYRSGRFAEAAVQFEESIKEESTPDAVTMLEISKQQMATTIP